MRRDVFQAIADPTRREIIQLIAGAPLHLNAIAEQFNISRPAVSKHIRILVECGLVSIRPEGRERYCEPRLQQLQEVAGWVAQYRTFWNQKLDALESFLQSEQEAPARSKRPPKKGKGIQPLSKKQVASKRPKKK